LSTSSLVHGVVVGKFLPPHRGHHLLIDEANSRCEHLTVVVSGRSVEPIPLALRVGWIQDRHPDVTVVGFIDDHPVNFDDADTWQYWADRFVEGWRTAPAERGGDEDHVDRAGLRPDLLFSSEPYGEELAARMGCTHEPVDPDRVAIPVSGTVVRADPIGAFEFLEPAVQAYFTRIVEVDGPALLFDHVINALVAELGTTAGKSMAVRRATSGGENPAQTLRISVDPQEIDPVARVRREVAAFAERPWHGQRYAPQEPGDRSRRFASPASSTSSHHERLVVLCRVRPADWPWLVFDGLHPRKWGEQFTFVEVPLQLLVAPARALLASRRPSALVWVNGRRAGYVGVNPLSGNLEYYLAPWARGGVGRIMLETFLCHHRPGDRRRSFFVSKGNHRSRALLLGTVQRLGWRVGHDYGVTANRFGSMIWVRAEPTGARTGREPLARPHPSEGSGGSEGSEGNVSSTA